jgi:hypothetical protein
MKSIRTLFLLVAVSLFGSGCSLMAPQYTGSIDNVQKLKSGAIKPVKVGEFTSIAGKENANPISLRGSSMTSPYESSYAKYLAEALKIELALANKNAVTSDFELLGSLVKNDLDASGFATGTGDIQARFVVKKGEEVRYDQVKTAHTQWESSFIGATAIPRATQEYSNLVKQLLAALYSDVAFQESTK